MISSLTPIVVLSALLAQTPCNAPGCGLPRPVLGHHFHAHYDAAYEDCEWLQEAWLLVDQVEFLWPAAVLHLQGFGDPAIGVSGCIRSDDYPETWVPIRACQLTAIVELPILEQNATHLQLKLDGKSVVSAKDPENTLPACAVSEEIGLTYAYRLPCLAVGKHVLQARYRADGRWSHWSQPLRIEIHGPDRPVIEGAGPANCAPLPVHRGDVVEITTDTMELKLANVLPGDKVIAYLNGKAINCGQGCCVQVPLTGQVEPGIHRLTVRTMPVGNCAVTSEPSEEITLHYSAPQHYVLQLLHPTQPQFSKCPCPVKDIPDVCPCKRGAGKPSPAVRASIGDAIPASRENTEYESLAAIHYTAVHLPSAATHATTKARADETANNKPAASIEPPKPAPVPIPTGVAKQDPVSLAALYSKEAWDLEKQARASLETIRSLSNEATVNTRDAEMSAEQAAASELAARQAFGSGLAARTNFHYRSIAFQAKEARCRHHTAAVLLELVHRELQAAVAAAERATAAATNAYKASERTKLTKASTDANETAVFRSQAEVARDRVLGVERRARDQCKQISNAAFLADQHEEHARVGVPRAETDAQKRADEQARRGEIKNAKSRSVVFASAAHFPIREFGLRGEPMDREGLVIHEDMRLWFDRDGNYEVRFQSTLPEMPVTVRLQFLLQPDENRPWYTITLAPIKLPYPLPKTTEKLCSLDNCSDSEKDPQCCGKPHDCVCKGKSEILRRCFDTIAPKAQIRRTGTARFGFGVNVP